MDNNSFSETQKFRQWWVWVILLVSICAAIVGISKGDTHGSNMSKQTVMLITILASLVPIGLVVILFVFMKLETKIDGTGVYYRFFPIQMRMQHMEWTDIEQAYVRKYSPIKEYGGWGYRYSFRNGMAYNIAGNMGLQIVKKGGKKILIGTQKPDEVAELLKRFAEMGIARVQSEASQNSKDRF
ncbi:MAG: hypothetical protein WCG87_12975 [Bacteroidota bacterium]